MPEFQSTISLGVIIHLVVLVATIVASFWKLRLEISKEVDKIRQEFSTRLSVTESRVGDLWEWWKKDNGIK